jgi:iron complex transport system substrate-binding protein
MDCRLAGFRLRRNDETALLRFALILFAALCAAAPAFADAPRRVVSFNVCADQLVVGLADPDQIVALSPYAADPESSVVAAEARAYPRVGWTAESIVPLAPDLILVGPWDRSLTQRMLRALGMRIEPVDLVSDIESGIKQIREVAALLGHPERGAELITKIETARARLAATRPQSATALLVGNAGYTVGPTSLAGALLKQAGLNPPAGAPSGYGGYVPLEKLLMLRPDYLVVSNFVERPEGQGALYLTHPAVQALYPPERQLVLPTRYTLCGGAALAAALDFMTGLVRRIELRPTSDHARAPIPQ